MNLSSMVILDIFRAVFGLVFVLFLPGYFCSILLFPKKEVDILERIILSFCLSLAIVSPLLFFLNKIIDIKINLINCFSVISSIIVIEFMIYRFRSKF